MLTRLTGTDLLRPRPLPCVDATARVALVAPSASLLAGDALRIDVTVGRGAQLELLEVAATVAHPGRGGPPADLRVAVRVAAGATLSWDARPLVLSAGCDLRRAITIELEAGATMLLRDTLVFGRAGEQPGAFTTLTVVTYAGAPLHVEGLDTSDAGVLGSEAVLGQARVLDTVAIYGARRDGPGALQLAGPGSLLMIPAVEAAAAHATADRTFRRWRAPASQPAATCSISSAA